MNRRWRQIAVVVYLGAWAAWHWLPFPQDKLARYPASTAVLDRRGAPLRVTISSDETLCLPVALSETGPWLSHAIIAAEDKRFFQHSGVDALALGRAVRQNLIGRRVVSGASTISTQVIRLIEPRSRNVWTKLVEAVQALRMERRFSKQQILEQYLNRAPFGSNVIGVEAASRRYFDKSAADLSLAEAALLAGLPQAPTRLRPDLFPARAAKRRDYVLGRMRDCGFVSDEQLAAAQREPIVCRGGTAVFRAPHFCELVLARSERGTVLRTTLDSSVQIAAEELLRRQVSDLASQGVHGGALVVLEVKTGAVRALVGSPDFAERRWQGQVNGALARRSPGSALKPFVYALGIDQGLYTPASLIADVPLVLADYRPQNFEREFSGPVTVREALVRSLNIPALRATQAVGQENVVRLLRAAGLTTLDKPAEHYGLGIALGDGEVRLLDLVSAYAAFANSGEVRPWLLLENETTADTTRRLFSAETAFLVSEMLSGEERAADLCGHVAEAQTPRIAWKTGTSSAHRDAWTVAYNPEFVVGVWLGNPDGRGAACLVGRAVAAPVAFEMFRRLYPRGAAPWFVRPAGLKQRRVCSRSGCVASAACPVTILDDGIAGISSENECPEHSGHAVRQSFGDLVAKNYLRTHGNGDAESDGQKRGGNLRIVAPVSGETICRLAPVATITLHAVAGGAAAPVHWYVNGEWLASRRADQAVAWQPTRGRHVISCSDECGNSDAVQVSVE